MLLDKEQFEQLCEKYPQVVTQLALDQFIMNCAIVGAVLEQEYPEDPFIRREFGEFLEGLEKLRDDPSWHLKQYEMGPEEFEFVGFEVPEHILRVLAGS